ncbi:MAG TPA: hypothetical protein C5S50_03190 [Methanosarcinaceae archaeon]|nr:hypothetical protein [Methanosarcinaceae archaeon]
MYDLHTCFGLWDSLIGMILLAALVFGDIVSLPLHNKTILCQQLIARTGSNVANVYSEEVIQWFIDTMSVFQ